VGLNPKGVSTITMVYGYLTILDYGYLTIIYITEVIYIEIFDQASAAQNPILDVTKEATARLHGFTKTSLSREKLWISMGFLWVFYGFL
jgi:hypothetical protein